MITIYLNEQAIHLAENTSLAQALNLHGYNVPHIAVAINQTFVARSQHHSTYLQAQDRVEIVSPLQGG